MILNQRALAPAAVELAVKRSGSHGPKSSLPAVIATTTSRPMIWRFMWASALSSPVPVVAVGRDRLVGGELFEPRLVVGVQPALVVVDEDRRAGRSVPVTSMEGVRAVRALRAATCL